MVKKTLIILILYLSIFPAFAKINPDLISLKLTSINNKQNTLTAKIHQTTTKGKDLGLDDLELKGTIEKPSLFKGKKKISIVWDKAIFNNTEMELDDTLSSKILLQNNKPLKKGDVFNAKGKAENLVEVFKELKKKTKQTYVSDKSNSTDKESQKNNESHYISSAERVGSASASLSPSPSSSSANNIPEIEGVAPDYSSEEIITTSEGCEIRIDEVAGKATVQTRQLQGNKEISPCSDSDAVYELTKNYDECPDYKDEENKKIYKQYTLGYNDPSVNGRIQIKSCTIDKEQFTEIIEKIITTSEGCEIRIDEVAGKAIAQTRQLQGNKEIAPCSDSDVAYELVRNYKECVDYIDYQEGKAFEQYTLSYNNPEIGGAVRVYNCTIDKEKFAKIQEDTSACSIRHDFKNDYSIQQSRITYTDDNGGLIVLQDCKDTQTKYPHQETYDGCSDDIANGAVIFNSRKFIVVDGDSLYITECLPQENSRITIHEEVCKNRAYEHDFETNQSYRIKTFFYYKNNQRININECVRSEDSLIHKYDISDCQHINDDNKLQTQYYAKTYIEDAGGKVIIRDCNKSGQPIPYIQTKKKWLIDKTDTGHFAILSPNFPERTIYLGWYNLNTDPAQCYIKTILDTWTIKSNGVDINEKYSDEFLKYKTRIWTSYHHHENHYYLDCYDPHCTKITNLSKYNIYTRGDHSEYIAKNSPLEKMVVCGNGSKIANTEE